MTDFIDDHGDQYNTLRLTGSWSHDTRNKAIFADKGGLQRFVVEAAVPGSELEYYKVDYRQQRYVPLTRNLTLEMSADIGFGDGYGDFDELPFFENYFAGGVRSVRGFEDNSLGPLDSKNNPIGGSMKLVGGAELFFPVPFLEASNSYRMSAFFDIGNVYDGVDSFDASDLRYSVGLGGIWLSPMGPLAVSIGFPLNDESDDDVQNFQFTFGSFF